MNRVHYLQFHNLIMCTLMIANLQMILYFHKILLKIQRSSHCTIAIHISSLPKIQALFKRLMNMPGLGHSAILFIYFLMHRKTFRRIDLVCMQNLPQIRIYRMRTKAAEDQYHPIVAIDRTQWVLKDGFTNLLFVK